MGIITASSAHFLAEITPKTRSSNILIGYNVQGTASENNVLRVGVATGTGDGDLAAAYVCGINGVTVTGSPVLVNSSNQLAAGGI